MSIADFSAASATGGWPSTPTTGSRQRRTPPEVRRAAAGGDEGARRARAGRPPGARPRSAGARGDAARGDAARSGDGDGRLRDAVPRAARRAPPPRLGEANRFGGGALSTLAGPEIGTAAELLGIWNRTREGDFKAADSFRLLWGNLPFVNMFYVRPAIYWLFLNALYESLSPGYLRRQERNRRREYGQERLWEVR